MIGEAVNLKIWRMGNEMAYGVMGGVCIGGPGGQRWEASQVALFGWMVIFRDFYAAQIPSRVA